MPPKRQSSRREFLKGRAAVNALGDLAQGGDEPNLPPIESGSEGYLVHLHRRAMACQFQVFINAGQHEGATEAAIEALDLVDLLEAQLTVYRDDSEVSLLNQLAGSNPQRVEPRLFALLQQSVDLFRETDGAFDITSGPLSKVWGFYRREGQLPDDEALQEALDLVGSNLLELDEQELTLRFTRPDVELNLGSIGKGYALDRCGELLTDAGVADFLFHGGRSSILARGNQGIDSGQVGWTVGLGHPLWKDRRLAEVRLVNQALGTSGSGTQFFRHRGKRYGHILDPRTGQPARGVLSASVVAPTAALADALATAFYVMGPQAMQAYCVSHREIGAVLTLPGRVSGKIEIQSANLSDEQLMNLDESGRSG